MTQRPPAVIVGAYEHPSRRIEGSTIERVVADVTIGALTDAGLTLDDVDGLAYAGVHQGITVAEMADHLGLDALTYVDSTDIGGASYIAQIGHAAAAIERGVCSVVVVAMGGLPLDRGRGTPPGGMPGRTWEAAHGLTQVASYALVAARHMHEYGTTSEQLAEVKVAAASHAVHNPQARLRERVTIDDVIGSPLIADPLHRLDCCVTTDGGGAVVVVSPEIAAGLDRAPIYVLGQAETIRTTSAGHLDLMSTGADRTGPTAFAQAGVTPADIDYASLYDSFTITVLTALENLGFCERGAGGRFVADGALRAPHGRLPVNTDGGGLCNNHPDRRGGMIRTIEAVRQLRGEAAAPVQVAECELAVVHGVGHSLGNRASAATMVLGRGWRR